MKKEMNENVVLSAEEACRRIAEFDFSDFPTTDVMALFGITDDDGTMNVVYSDTDPFNVDGILCTAKMDWDKDAASKTSADFADCVETLVELATHFDELWEGADPATLIADPAAREVYNTYCVELDNGDFDMSRIYDITERKEAIELARSLKEMQQRGEPLDEQSLTYLAEVENTTVTEEEQAYLADHRAHLVVEATRRVGEGVMAYDAYVRGHRLWMLYGLNAPEVLKESEEHEFATAFSIHRHATSLEQSVVPVEWDEEE